ncbi:hypothetical protein L7F22_063333 [Adiantum nelumboides]|nr:hypothetical protein [Adiantum nelumboides]
MVDSPLLSDSNGMHSPVFSDAFSTLHKFLPSNTNDDDPWSTDAFLTVDAYSCDDFRMYELKVRRCMRGRSSWGEGLASQPPRPAQTFAAAVVRGVMLVSMHMEFLNVDYTLQGIEHNHVKMGVLAIAEFSSLPIQLSSFEFCPLPHLLSLLLLVLVWAALL